MLSGQLPNAVVSGLVLAGLYSVAGLAWVLLFRATKLLNFGTGQFIVLGAYFYFLLTTSFHLPFWGGFIAAVACMGAVGFLLQSVLLRRLLGTPAHAVGHAPFAPVILTFGVAAVVQHVVTMIFGPEPRSLPTPLPKNVIQLPGNAVITADGILIWVIAAALLVTTVLVIRYSKWGIQMRAAAEQPLLASQSGIKVGNVYIAAWAVASAICGIAGISYSYSTVLSPDLANIGIRSLAPVIVGGMDSAAGVLPGAIIVAIAENLLVLVFGEGVRDAAVMLVILCVLAIRPNGLFGTGDIRRL
jgi:branched-chain amino acid transport system permease protein